MNPFLSRNPRADFADLLISLPAFLIALTSLRTWVVLRLAITEIMILS